MKLYLDTADDVIIAELARTGLIDGITTNPTTLSKQNTPPREIIERLCALLPQGLISVEVTEKEPDAVYKQAHAIAKLSSTILVKIPCHILYYPIIKRLVDDGIRLNITLLFSVAQALWMFKLGVHTISPFIGRLDDAGLHGLEVLADICALRDQYGYTTMVLAASMRSQAHVEGALRLGADAVTMPPALFQSLVQHPLTDKGIAQFEQDWRNTHANIPFP